MRLAVALLCLTGCDLVFRAESQCPETYTMDKRYRVDTSETSWTRAAATCEADRPGLTHLAAPRNLGELDLIVSLIEADTWVGVGREPKNADVTFMDFRTVTGQPVSAEMFELGEPTMNANEFATIVMPARFGMFAANILDPRDFVCECDGEDVERFSFQAE